MKYKHDRMLPAHAFQVRGSVIGGRGMRLHGDSDDWWAQEEPQEDPNETFITTNYESGEGYYVPVAQPPSPPLAAPPPPPPTSAPVPAPAAPLAAIAPIAAPAAPAYTPFNLDEFGGLGGSDEQNAYYNTAKLANWQMERGRPDLAQQFITSANELKAQLSNPYRIGTQTTGGGGDGGFTTESVLFTPSGTYSVIPAEEGTGYYGAVSNYGDSDSGGSISTGAEIKLDELPKLAEEAQVRAFGTGFGPALGYEYEMKNSEGTPYKRFDAQGNLTEYLNIHGQWQKASDVKPTDVRFNPTTGQFDTLYSYGPRTDISGEWVPEMSKYHEDQGGFLGEGGWSRVAGLVAAGLTAGVAGGAFSGLGIGGAGAAVPGSAAAIGTAAAKGALTGIAVSGLQGASPQDMLKSGVLGAVSAGAGNFIGGAELGALGTKAARVGLQTGLAAISGGNVEQALISGIINNVLPDVVKEVMPADVTGALSELPAPIQKLVMSTAGSVLTAGFNGQDINNAAVSGVTNGLVSVAKDFASGVFKGLTDSELAQTIKGYFNPSSTAGDFTGAYEDSVATLPDDTDVVNRIFQQDADEAFNRNVPPPLRQETINLNTPVTAETVTTPPLIQTAMGQTNPDDVYDQLVDAFGNPQVGAPLSTLASATTSDSIITLPDGTRQLVVGDDGSGLSIGQNTYNPDKDAALLVDANGNNLPEGYRRVTLEEMELGLGQEYATSSYGGEYIVPISASANSSGGYGSMAMPSPESTASAIDAFVQAGGDTRAISSAESTQSPEYAVTEAFKAFFGRNPTDIELNTFAPSGAERLAPQEYLKNVFDYAQQEKQQEQQATFVEFVQPPPLVQEAINQNVEQVEPEKVEPQKVEPVKEDKKDTKAGGSGTQGGSLAGDEGRVGAAAPLATAAPSESAYGTTEEFEALDVTQPTNAVAVESQSIASELANLGAIDAADIPVFTANLNQSSIILNVTPTVAVTNGLVTNQGTLSDKGIDTVAADTGLSPQEVQDVVQGSSTIETNTGSGLKDDGAGGATGDGTGVSGDEGLGGITGEGVGGQGTGVGTGVGAGEGTGRGGGLPSSGGSYGGARLTLNPQFPGALPGALEGTYLKGVEVDEYDPFANYNVYQQLEPIRAAQGGSPLQLMQMQQGIVGYDPSSYRNVQFRPMPDYFTYGSKPQQPTTFAGSQLMGKPKPSIPVTPTGNVGSSDWLYGAAGSNQLSPAGAALPPLASGMMANGGQAQQNNLDEHIPEFITGATGHYVRGRGDGQSDDIPAMLADGEYVFDSSAVSTLGNGSSDAGAKLLDAFRETLREHTRSAPKDKIPPKASPLQYMQEAMKKVGMA